MEIIVSHLSLMEVIALLTVLFGLFGFLWKNKSDIQSLKDRNESSDKLHLDIKSSLDRLEKKVDVDIHTIDLSLTKRIVELESRARSTDIFNVRLEERVGSLQEQNRRILDILEAQQNVKNTTINNG